MKIVFENGKNLEENVEATVEKTMETVVSTTKATAGIFGAIYRGTRNAIVKRTGGDESLKDEIAELRALVEQLQK